MIVENVKNNSFHILAIWFLSYSFFINKFVSNKILINFGTKGLIPVVIIALMFPLILLLYKPLKKIQKDKLKTFENSHQAIFFVFKLFATLYLIMTSIYSLRHMCSFMTNYYFNIVSLILEIFLFLGVVLYASKNNFKCLSAMSIIIGMYILIESTIYIFTGFESNFFVISFSSSFSFVEIIKLIIYLSMYIIDLLLLLIHVDESEETIKIKHLLFFSFLLAFLNIFEKVKMVLTLGPLITRYNYPSFEVWRLSSIPFMKANIDFIPLIGWMLIVFMRLSLSIFLLNKLWNNNKKSFNIPILLGIGIITYLISTNFEISSFIDKDAYIFLFIVGVVPFVLLFLMIRKRKGRLERVK